MTAAPSEVRPEKAFDVEHSSMHEEASHASEQSHTPELNSCTCNSSSGADVALSCIDSERKTLKDGGGVTSTGDWSSPAEPDYFESLRADLYRFIDQDGLVERCEHKIPKPSGGQEGQQRFSQNQLEHARHIIRHHLRNSGVCESWLKEGVSEGQPFHLGLLQGLLATSSDVDSDLPNLLREGVVTGVFDDIQPSGVWRPCERTRSPTDTDIRQCDQNWRSADENSDMLDELLRMEVKNGFLVDALLQ